MSKNRKYAKSRNWKPIVAGLALATVLVALGTFVFATSVETLDVQAEKLGLTGENLFPAPFPEYTIPGVENVWANLVLGVVSTVLVFAVTWAVANILRQRRRSRGSI
jgi:putative effector of murein hydrolase LrgA (UPF0299 family)